MKQLNSEKSFSLAELLIVLTIIGILMTVSFPYYQSARERLALHRAASRLAQDLRKIQEMAMSIARAEECFLSDGRPRFGDDYKYGFSIEFKTGEDTRDKYTLFSDCNGTYKYEGVDDDMWMSLTDFDLVEIDSIDVSGAPMQRLDITFTPPDPSVTFWAVPSPGILDVPEASIVLRVKNDRTKTKTITLNRAGLITIK